tara:strand:- start:261 stop:599 length:339 start_codon:yes stop_codon:yes gene_type:complete
MSVSPGEYNILLQRRASYSLGLQFQGGTGLAIDLTGAVVAAQIWDKAREVKYADFLVSYTDRVNGEVTIGLTDTQTTTLPSNLNYDVLVTSAGGSKDYYLEGKITVSQGYTA